MISDLLFSLFMASRKAYDESSDSYPEYGYENLRWYIATGRASAEFLNALKSLSNRRMKTLLWKCNSGCTDDGIAAAKKYLKVA